MDLEEISKLYYEGYDCAQSVIYAMKDRIDANTDDIMRSVSCMGMGLLQGSVCGAILGAYVIIGLKYGNDKPDFSMKGLALVKKEQFMIEFRKKYNGITCPELMGLDIRKGEDNIKAFQGGVYTNHCPKMCLDIVNILEKIL